MKKTILTMALVAAAMPTMAQQVAYAVSGTYGKEGKKVYLMDQLTEKAVDSVAVADGKFSFSGRADKDALLGVMAEGSDWTTGFFNDGTPVSVNVNDSTVKGSPLNERLAKYEKEVYRPKTAFSEKTSKMTEQEIIAHQDELMDEMNSMIDNITANAIKVFDKERNTLIPVAFSGFYFMENGVDAFDELVKQQVAFANHPYLKKSRDEIAKMMGLQDNEKTAFIGQQFTDLEMEDPDGKMHKISELVGEGHWVLVDFWASWCGPCRAEMPNVLEAYNKYHAKGFEVVGVSFDNKKETWVKAISQLSMPWLQISDLKGWKCAAADVYKIDGIPDNILIDPQGKIIGRGLRGMPLQKKLQKIFGE